MYKRQPILSAHPVKYASLNNGSIAYKIKVNGDTSVSYTHLLIGSYQIP